MFDSSATAKCGVTTEKPAYISSLFDFMNTPPFVISPLSFKPPLLSPKQSNCHGGLPELLRYSQAIDNVNLSSYSGNGEATLYPSYPSVYINRERLERRMMGLDFTARVEAVVVLLIDSKDKECIISQVVQLMWLNE